MKIEKYLVLNKYFLSLFGVKDFRDLQLKLKDTKEGIDTDGRTHFINVLIGLPKFKINEDELLRYDKNIQEYERKINHRRGNVSLKYFQYLAILFTEIFLDNLKNNNQTFLKLLNDFLDGYEDEDVKNLIKEFTENDLKKLAFWMATGSGKTLIAHINYYQFFEYNLFSPDNIVFITPNEGLSKQHCEELMKSGIPARMYSGSLNGGIRAENEVLVIEMTKFAEEKKGGGVTLPVDVFEGNNLIFVDEGHKGRKSEEQKWAKLRDKLSENGFVFEYSATFGQVLSERNKETLKEYSKSILFDYSYKYFYLDGYGKDFLVLNAKEVRLPEGSSFQETMFTANLLSFYEQLLLYERKTHLAKEHNIEKPLWIFVGTTVTGKDEESDVLEIVRFMKRITDDGKWLKERVEFVLSGKTGISDNEGEDVFRKRFELLRKEKINIDDIFYKVFHGRGSFEVFEIKNAEGEFGLKVGESPYFGVINIGDVSGFKKLLEQAGIPVKQDTISSSLFEDIRKESSNINVLIGSKKFIEGWDTWRVSSMGLLNIGKGQGPQIIQLFGRGVRLKGKNMTLKRSENKEIALLETLNIYGIKADYLNKFLEAIRKEEIELEEIKIPVEPLEKEKWGSLPYLKKRVDEKYEEKEMVFLDTEETIHYTLNLTPRVVEYIGRERAHGKDGEVRIGISMVDAPVKVEEKKITDIIDLELLDWGSVLNEVYQFKIMRNYWNLVFTKDSISEILERCRVKALSDFFEVRNLADIERIEKAVVLLIKGYIDRLYKKHRAQFETKNFEYSEAGKQLELFASEEQVEYYTVWVDKNKSHLIKEIRELAINFEKLKEEDRKVLPRVCFDNHIYVPILLEGKEIERISPPGLVESEKEFVKGLKNFLNKNKKNKNTYSGYEVYLLRNEAKSGIGFQLEWAGFYPDFIMWIKGNGKVWIVFVDPKGLHHSKGLEDEKILFARKELKDIERRLNGEIYLESFIISETKYEDLNKGLGSPLPKEKYKENNVLFFEDNNWCKEMFEKLVFGERK